MSSPFQIRQNTLSFKESELLNETNELLSDILISLTDDQLQSLTNYYYNDYEYISNVNNEITFCFSYLGELDSYSKRFTDLLQIEQKKIINFILNNILNGTNTNK